MTIYIFKARKVKNQKKPKGHLTLAYTDYYDQKSVVHNGSIDLSDKDIKRDIIQKMIANGKSDRDNVDRLILAPKPSTAPEQPNAPEPPKTDDKILSEQEATDLNRGEQEKLLKKRNVAFTRQDKEPDLVKKILDSNPV